MRFVVLSVLVVLVACTAREPGPIASTAEIPARFQLEGHGIFMEIEATGGARGVVAHEVPVTPEHAWPALAEAFEALGFRGAGVLDEARRVYAYPDAVMPRRIGGQRLSAFLECGRNPAGPNADSYRVVGTVLATVRPAGGDGRTVVESSVEATARPREVSGNAVRCSSNGRLERLLAYTATMRAIESH